MEYDLYEDGVSCIEHTQVGVEKFIKLAGQLGIEWFVLADSDAAGIKYAKSARNNLKERDEDEHIKLLSHETMELFLCMENFVYIYESTISDQKKNQITAEQNTVEYWEQILKAQKRNSKPRNALIVAEQIVQQGMNSVPQLLRNVIEQTRALARSAD